MSNIAIIGGGIGGFGLVHYLKQSSSDYEITIYEKNDRIGGRIRSFDVDGYMVEVGAVYFHSANQLINKLVEDMGLEKGIMERQPLGLWNGTEFVFKQGSSELLNNLRLLFRFGFRLTKLLGLVSEIKSKVQTFYEDEVIFETIDEMLEIVEFSELAKRSLIDILKEKGFTNKMIDELIIPTSRYVYHHSGSAEMNGFAGLVSMIAYDNSPVYYVKEGNQMICEKIAQLHEIVVKTGSKVSKINKTQEGYAVETDEGIETYDIVVLACPLSIADIDIDGINQNLTRDIQYEGYFKTIVIGDVNPAYFNQHSLEDVPPMILTKKNPQFPVYGFERLGSTKSRRPIYELTSTDRLEDAFIEDIFEKVDRKEEYSLEYSFPYLIPPSNYDPIVVDHNFYYLSTVDMISPTLESSLLVARAIAKMIDQSNT